MVSSSVGEKRQTGFGSWWESFVTDFGEAGLDLVIIGV